MDRDAGRDGLVAAVMPVERERQGGEGPGDGLSDMAGAEHQQARATGVDRLDQGVAITELRAAAGEGLAAGVDEPDQGAGPLIHFSASQNPPFLSA